jgi:hypothetical protein
MGGGEIDGDEEIDQPDVESEKRHMQEYGKHFDRCPETKFLNAFGKERTNARTIRGCIWPNRSLPISAGPLLHESCP